MDLWLYTAAPAQEILDCWGDCKTNRCDIAAKLDFVIINGEAGVLQIIRRVVKKVDLIMLVSDISAKAVDLTALAIARGGR